MFYIGLLNTYPDCFSKVSADSLKMAVYDDEDPHLNDLFGDPITVWIFLSENICTAEVRPTFCLLFKDVSAPNEWTGTTFGTNRAHITQQLSQLSYF